MLSDPGSIFFPALCKEIMTMKIGKCIDYTVEPNHNVIWKVLVLFLCYLSVKVWETVYHLRIPVFDICTQQCVHVRYLPGKLKIASLRPALALWGSNWMLSSPEVVTGNFSFWQCRWCEKRQLKTAHIIKVTYLYSFQEVWHACQKHTTILQRLFGCFCKFEEERRKFGEED